MLSNIILYIVALPVCLIDKLNEKDGGIFGGNIRPFFTSAIAEALYICAIIIFLVNWFIDFIRS